MDQLDIEQTILSSFFRTNLKNGLFSERMVFSNELLKKKYCFYLNKLFYYMNDLIDLSFS